MYSCAQLDIPREYAKNPDKLACLQISGDLPSKPPWPSRDQHDTTHAEALAESPEYIAFPSCVLGGSATDLVTRLGVGGSGLHTRRESGRASTPPGLARAASHARVA